FQKGLFSKCIENKIRNKRNCEDILNKTKWENLLIGLAILYVISLIFEFSFYLLNFMYDKVIKFIPICALVSFVLCLSFSLICFINHKSRRIIELEMDNSVTIEMEAKSLSLWVIFSFINSFINLITMMISIIL
ncbi:hypothetical protein HZS_7732, partial [Henneguya salminicola]